GGAPSRGRGPVANGTAVAGQSRAGRPSSRRVRGAEASPVRDRHLNQPVGPNSRALNAPGQSRVAVPSIQFGNVLVTTLSPASPTRPCGHLAAEDQKNAWKTSGINANLRREPRYRNSHITGLSSGIPNP